MTAFNYAEGKMVKLVYSDVRRHGERCFTTKQVCEMVDRAEYTVTQHIRDGNVPAPQNSYPVDGDRSFVLQYYWSEKDILALHDYLKTVHIGRPRKDGETNTRDLPSATELRAMIRQGVVLYVKNDKGEFVPTWRSETL